MLQMLILAAVSAAVLAGIGGAIVTMFKSQATVAQSLDARLFNEQLAQVLSSDERCTDFFNGVTYNAAGNEVPINKQLVLASGTKTITAGSPIDENLEVYVATARMEPATLVSVVQKANTYRIAQTVFKLQLRKRSSNAFVQTLQPMEIRLLSSLGAGNDSRACSAFSAGSLACMAEGGIWSPESADGEKCIPQRYCQYAGSYSDAPLSDGGFANPLTGANSCPADFVPQISGLINKAAASGKYSVTNTPYRVYTCMSCGTPLAAQTAATYTPGAAQQVSSVNEAAYEAVMESDDNTATLAEADTSLAKKKWDDGVALSNQYQTNINNAYAQISYAQSAESSAASNFTGAANNLSSAQAGLSAAQAIVPADPAAVASAQSSVDAASNAYNAASTDYSNAQSNTANVTSTQNGVISQNTSWKNAQDLVNVGLRASYYQYKAVSDYYRIVANCSAAKFSQKKDPSLAPDSCDAIPACPVDPPSVTVVTPYGSC